MRHEDQFAHLREVGKHITVIPVKKAASFVYFLNAILVLKDVNLYKEMGRLIASKRFSKENIVKLFVYFSRAHYEAGLIHKKMKNQIENDSIFYSYRFEYQPYVAMLLRKKWKLKSRIVSRAHRYELYEEVHSGNYIPMREKLLSELDGVYPCSENGSRYLKSKFPEYRKKISTRYLGTKDYGIEDYICEDESIRIVSCSNVIPVKRLDILVEALSLLKEKNIVWIHFGDGKMLKEIRLMAEKKLSGKIGYEFAGNIDNQKLMREYARKSFRIFVNVSASEGLPVSIMEAMSFGIPCIATNVGGSSAIGSRPCNQNGL